VTNETDGDNPYAYQEPPPAEKIQREGPIKVTRSSAADKAKQQRTKQATAVRRGRSIARSGILFFAILYFGTAAMMLVGGSILGGLQGGAYAAAIGSVPAIIGMVYVGLLFWAKSKTAPATISAIVLGILVILPLALIGGRWSVVYLVVATGYCMVGLSIFRKERNAFNHLLAEHRRKELL